MANSIENFLRALGCDMLWVGKVDPNKLKIRRVVRDVTCPYTGSGFGGGWVTMQDFGALRVPKHRCPPFAVGFAHDVEPVPFAGTLRVEELLNGERVTHEEDRVAPHEPHQGDQVGKGLGLRGDGCGPQEVSLE